MTVLLKGSILLFGGNAASRREKCTQILKAVELTNVEKNPDVLLLEIVEGKKTIGIDQVRTALKYLSEKPFQNKYKAVVVEQAQKLTTDAQNALLKVLEEPPSYASIILCTRTEEELLPTVVSRCQKVRVDSRNTQATLGGVGERAERNTINSVLSMTLGERLSWAETQSKEEKDDILKLLESWVHEERESMVDVAGTHAAEAEQKRLNIESILEIKTDLEKTNVNLRLALEFLVLSLQK